MHAKRTAILLYGALVYAFFLPVFLYAVGFVTDVLVPRSVDRPVTGDVDLWPAVLGNVALLGAFGLQHSIMARRWFKARWTKVVHPAAERSTFVLVTCVLLVGLYLFWQPIPQVVWSVESPALATALEAIAFAGFGLVLYATFVIDHFELFGLRQVIRHFRGVEHRPPRFQVRSVYRWTRHPLYLGFFLAFWSTSTMTLGHLLFAAVTTSWVLLTVRLEERDLVAEHGAAYEDYRRRVPQILPLPGRSATRTARTAS